MNDIWVVGLSLAGSAIINIAGIWYQYRIVKPSARKRQNVDEWYLDTVAIARNLRRESIRIQPGYAIDPVKMEPKDDESPVDLTEIELIIDDLCKLRDEAPASISDSVIDKIDDIEYWFNNTHPKPRKFDSHDVHEKLSKEGQELIDRIASYHEEIEAGSY